MNRPYGAVDVSANLKGAVPKTSVQKILVALAEKGDLTQKAYGEDGKTRRIYSGCAKHFLPGKTTFYVYNQSKIESLPNDRIKEINEELITLEEDNKLLSAEVKLYSGGKLQDPSH